MRQQYLDVATFATNLHTLYTTIQGILGTSVPIVFLDWSDEINASGLRLHHARPVRAGYPQRSADRWHARDRCV